MKTTTALLQGFASPDSIAKAYTRFVSNIADNTVSAIRLTNNMIFSNLDSMEISVATGKGQLKTPVQPER